jgi:hypothetical protein
VPRWDTPFDQPDVTKAVTAPPPRKSRAGTVRDRVAEHRERKRAQVALAPGTQPRDRAGELRQLLREAEIERDGARREASEATARVKELTASLAKAETYGEHWHQRAEALREENERLREQLEGDSVPAEEPVTGDCARCGEDGTPVLVNGEDTGLF